MSPFEKQIEPYEKEIIEIYLVLFLAGLAVIFLFVGTRLRQAVRDWAAIVFRVSCRPWSWIDLSVIVGGVILLSYTFAICFRGKFEAEAFAPLAISMALTHGTILLAVLVIAGIKRIRLRSAFGGGSHRFLRDIGAGAMGYLSMIVVVCPAMFATAGILKLLNREPAPQEILGLFAMQKSVFSKVYFSVWTVLVAPVAEEMLFRGILLPLLLRALPSAAAIGIVSLGFAALHGDMTAFLPLFAVSVSLCLAYLTTESLVVSITMHALFNSVTTAVLLMTA